MIQQMQQMDADAVRPASFAHPLSDVSDGGAESHQPVTAGEACFVDIQRGSLHDGPGVRTTFFLKGCPLRCRWCHNPETWRSSPQLSYHAANCVMCGRCAAVCPHQVHRIDEGIHTVDFSRCVACGRCVDACQNKALKVIGTRHTQEKAVSIARRDRMFYEQTGGGVTLSGGEPLLQFAFASEFLRRCREEGIHTCLETSGFGSEEAIRRMLPTVDLWYFDWKVSDEESAAKYLGVPLHVIRKNLNTVLESGARVVLRCPIIPGVNDHKKHFGEIATLLDTYPSLEEAQLLPYHPFGVDKSRNIGSEEETFRTPEESDLNAWTEWFRENAPMVAGRVHLNR